MKTKKCTALLAVLTLLLALWTPMAVTATPAAQQEELFYFGRSILEQMDNGKALCYAYDKLVEGIANQEESVDISHPTYRLEWQNIAASTTTIEINFLTIMINFYVFAFKVMMTYWIRF